MSERIKPLVSFTHHSSTTDDRASCGATGLGRARPQLRDPGSRPCGGARATVARRAGAPRTARQGGAGDSILQARGREAASIPRRGVQGSFGHAVGGARRDRRVSVRGPDLASALPSRLKGIWCTLGTHRLFSSSKLSTSRGRRLSPLPFFFLRPIPVRLGWRSSLWPKTLPGVACSVVALPGAPRNYTV